MFETPTIAEFLAHSNLASTMPGTLLVLWTLVLVLVDLFAGEERQHWTPILACVGLGVSFVLNLFVYSPAEGEQIALYGMFVADAFTGFLNMVILVATLISILMSWDYLHRADIHRGEFYILALLSSAGAMFMVGANDLIIVFVSLELLSIPLYILAAFRSIKNDGTESALKSEESGMKYFILGAFSSAFLVFGSALVYGATGSTNIPEIFSLVGSVASTTSAATFYLLIGAALLFVGLGFKVAVVPFHMWTPDVYEGAPTPVTAFMSVTAKIGGFAALLRILVTGFAALIIVEGEPVAWQAMVSIVAVLTLVLGNFVAIAQSNLKRMLAYSSIAHAGYILVAVAAAGTAGVADAATQSAPGLYAGIYVHQSGCLCRRHGDRKGRWQRRQYRRHHRFGEVAPLDGDGDDYIHAQSHRNTIDRRFCRQIHGVCLCGASRTLRIGRCWRSDERGQRVLLHARSGQHVPA